MSDEIEVETRPCPFCAQPMTGVLDYNYGYPRWDCACGAIGVCATPGDMDDAADQLLAYLGIEATVTEPAVPVGDSGMIFATPFNDKNARAALQRIAQAAGYRIITKENNSELVPYTEIFASPQQNETQH